MIMKHLIIEGFCEGSENGDKCSCNGTLKWGIHYFECPMFSYTYCPNEIALSNADGIVEDCIGFGGDMEPSESENREQYIAMWNKLCKEKITEAYDEFIEYIKKIRNL